jgi:2-phospho-L-lactate guanylyltransferase
VTCWVVIPVKAPSDCKSRLAAVLDEAARAELVSTMLRRVVAAAQGAKGVDGVALVGPSRHGLPEDIELLHEAGLGLNRALDIARKELSQRGVIRLLTVAGDLPDLTTGDVEQLAALPVDTLGIATDRHGTGTNALSLPLPAAAEFAFAFGQDSFARHQAEVARLRLNWMIIQSQGLVRDIDEPVDLIDAADLFAEPLRLALDRQQTWSRGCHLN